MKVSDVGAGVSPSAPCLDGRRLGAVPGLVEGGEEHDDRRVTGEVIVPEIGGARN